MKIEIFVGEVAESSLIRIEGRDINCWVNGMKETVAPRPLELSGYVGKVVVVSGILHGELYRAEMLTPNPDEPEPKRIARLGISNIEYMNIECKSVDSLRSSLSQRLRSFFCQKTQISPIRD